MPTTHEPEPGQQGGAPLDELKAALGDYADALANSMLKKATSRLGGLSERVLGENAGQAVGSTAGIAKRVLKGESPVKALLSEKVKGVREKITGGLSGGGEGGGLSGLLGGGGKGGGGGGKGNLKATNIVEVLDVAVPLRTAYDQWSQFEDFGGFMNGVRAVKKSDEVGSDWKLKVGPSSRSWNATIEEQIPDDRIVWTSQGAKGSTNGAVTFHELAPRLTRIVVVVEYHPSGFFEKTGNLWRAQGRRLRLDLKHFARHVTLHGDEELEGWRGEIRDGEVVRSHEDAMQEEEAREESRRSDEEDYEEEGYDEDEGPYEGEPRGDEDEDEYGEDEYAEDESGDEEDYGEDEYPEGDEEDEYAEDEYEEGAQPEEEDEFEQRPRRRR